MLIKDGLKQFNGKNVLLLQGPIGPFFKRLSCDLEAAGATVFKINFNGGDYLFYRKNAVNFKDKLSDWPKFFEKFIVAHNIDSVMLFGDCRPIHKTAHAIAMQNNIEICVFEEGYIRPDYITLERFGVNGYSAISKSSDDYDAALSFKSKHSLSIGKPFWFAALWGILYYLAHFFTRPYFIHYEHHRSLSLWHSILWIRSFWRKLLYNFQQKDILNTLINNHHKKYFLVALQVHNDAQIHHHSDFTSVDEFISGVINSFVLYAPADCQLVIKHHPMDRGVNHYGNLINMICQNSASRARVSYVHDLHLPTLLNHAKGVVVINSTVGMSALDLQCPVIVCGNAIYDIVGLTYQGNLSSFWQDAAAFKIDQKLHSKFLHHLIQHSQINGNFYKRLDNVTTSCGLNWTE